VSDVDRWFNTYGVDGIFIDQVSHHHPGRAQSLVEEIQARRSDALIVLNPGSTPDEKFVEDTNPAIVVVRETEFENFANWPAMTDEPWIANRTNPPVDGEIKAGRMAIIAHTIPNPADVDVLIAKAEEYRIGWIHAQYTPEHPADYNAFSVHLPLLARRLDKCARWGCILPFGYLFCKIGNAILCLGSQTAELLRTAIGRRLRRWPCSLAKHDYIKISGGDPAEYLKDADPGELDAQWVPADPKFGSL